MRGQSFQMQNATPLKSFLEQRLPAALDLLREMVSLNSFTGNREGWFFALDARTGGLLWKKYLGGQVIASPITYQANGKQYVAIAAGTSLFAFALSE